MLKSGIWRSGKGDRADRGGAGPTSHWCAVEWELTQGVRSVKCIYLLMDSSSDESIKKKKQKKKKHGGMYLPKESVTLVPFLRVWNPWCSELTLLSAPVDEEDGEEEEKEGEANFNSDLELKCAFSNFCLRRTSKLSNGSVGVIFKRLSCCRGDVTWRISQLCLKEFQHRSVLDWNRLV